MKHIERHGYPIEAIQTYFMGYRFRSRTEARWAVFLNAAGINFEYEKEGFVLESTPYLPDFYLPDLKIWLEIKGNEPTLQEMNKCRLLSHNSQENVLLCIGTPVSRDSIILFNPNPLDPYNTGTPMRFHLTDDRRNDGEFYLLNESGYHIQLNDLNKAPHDRLPMVRALTARGYMAAQSARFEHGEKGWANGTN